MAARSTKVLLVAAFMTGTAAAAAPPVEQSSTGVPQASSSASQAPPQTVGLRDDRHDRLTVPVMIAGSGPYRFLVDTGAERTILAREVADRLRLQRGPNRLLVDMASRKEVETAVLPTLGIARTRADSLESPLVSGADLGADGLLGIDSLSRQRVLLDFRKREMTLVPSLGRGGVRLGDGTIVVRARERRGRLILTSAAANGEQVQAVVDTGSQISVGNMALRQQLLGKRRTVAEPITIQSATGESMTVEAANLRELRIGGMRLTNALVLFTDSPAFTALKLDRTPALMIGMDVLRAFDRVGIDFVSRRLHFLPPEEFVPHEAQFASAAQLRSR